MTIHNVMAETPFPEDEAKTGSCGQGLGDMEDGHGL